MEREHTPPTYLTSHHQLLEEGDQFEISFLRLDRCYFLALLRVDTHLLQALWNDLRLSSVGFAFQKQNARCFKQLPHHRIPSVKSERIGKITEDEMGLICAKERAHFCGRISRLN